MVEMTPAKAAAREIMERDFERIGLRWMRTGDDQAELLRERSELEELWRLAGFGDPPEFRPTMALRVAG